MNKIVKKIKDGRVAMVVQTEVSIVADARAAKGEAQEAVAQIGNAVDVTTQNAEQTTLDRAATGEDVDTTNQNVVTTNNDVAKAKKWAEENEDVPVEPGAFSSKHHSLKSLAASLLTAQDVLDITQLKNDVIAIKEATEQIADHFGDRVLTAKAEDPLTDDDGDPLIEGTWYWNTTSKSYRIYDGAVWVDPSVLATSAANTAVAAKNDTLILKGEIVDIRDEVVLLADDVSDDATLVIGLRDDTEILRNETLALKNTTAISEANAAADALELQAFTDNFSNYIVEPVRTAYKDSTVLETVGYTILLKDCFKTWVTNILALIPNFKSFLSPAVLNAKLGFVKHSTIGSELIYPATVIDFDFVGIASPQNANKTGRAIINTEGELEELGVNDTTWDYRDGCGKLAMYPERTNRFTVNDFTAYTAARITKTEGAATLLGRTAATLMETAENNSHLIYRSLIVQIGDNGYTILVKAIGVRYISLRFTGGEFPNTSDTIYDLSLGVVDANGVNSKGYINKIGQDVYAVTLVGSPSSAGTNNITIKLLSDAKSEVYLGDVNRGIIISSPQVELGSTYAGIIPVDGLSITRKSNYFSKAGLQALGVFAADAGAFAIHLDDSTSWFKGVTVAADMIVLTTDVSNYIRVRGVDGAYYVEVVGYGSANPTQSFSNVAMLGIAWGAGTVKVYSGVLAGNDVIWTLLGTLVAPNAIAIDAITLSAPFMYTLGSKLITFSNTKLNL